MEEQGMGFITVNVRTAGGAIPIEGAVITIKTIAGENSTVVATSVTDRGGVTDIISLPAPSRENSQAPNGGEVNTLYEVDTDREGYYSVVNINVPIYDGVTSIQQVLLVPIAGGAFNTPSQDMTRFNDLAENPNL